MTSPKQPGGVFSSNDNDFLRMYFRRMVEGADSATCWLVCNGTGSSSTSANQSCFVKMLIAETPGSAVSELEEIACATNSRQAVYPELIACFRIDTSNCGVVLMSMPASSRNWRILGLRASMARFAAN